MLLVSDRVTFVGSIFTRTLYQIQERCLWREQNKLSQEIEKSLSETHETRGERELYSSECNLSGSGRSKLTKWIYETFPTITWIEPSLTFVTQQRINTTKELKCIKRDYVTSSQASWVAACPIIEKQAYNDLVTDQQNFFSGFGLKLLPLCSYFRSAWYIRDIWLSYECFYEKCFVPLLKRLYT